MERPGDHQVYLAYDGSLHGSWVARYAIHMAVRCPDRTLRAVHVQSSEFTADQISAARSQLERECVSAGAILDWTDVGPTDDIFSVLNRRIPDTTDTIVVCGTRSPAARSAYLDGSVAEHFLRQGQRQAFVIHVANPGFLGNPQNVLISIARHPDGIKRGLPLIELLAPDFTSVHVLLVQKLRTRLHISGSLETIRRLRNEGLAYVEQAERDLAAILLPSVMVDGHVKIAKSIPAEIVSHANRVRARLILLESPPNVWWRQCLWGNPLEDVLHLANCDVAIYRGGAAAK